MPKLIRHASSGDLVILAPGRSARPNSLFESGSDQLRCPFCPGHEEDTPPTLAELPAADGSWDLRVVPNRYPAAGTSGDALAGRHEVIIETPRHDESPYEFSVERLAALLGIYQRRLQSALDESNELVVLFKNCGAGAGETLSHAHSQLVALQSSGQTSRPDCRACEALAGAQIIEERDGIIALAPEGARFPFEVVITTAHGGTYSKESRIPQLAGQLAAMLRAFAVRFDRPSFNWYLDQRSGEEHWALTIIPRLSAVAGFELATGIWINVIEAERTARELRAALAR